MEATLKSALAYANDFVDGMTFWNYTIEENDEERESIKESISSFVFVNRCTSQALVREMCERYRQEYERDYIETSEFMNDLTGQSGWTESRALL